MLEAIILGMICLLLPRLQAQIKTAIKDIPQGMMAMAESLVPGLSVAQRTLKMIPLIFKAMMAVALVCGILGIVALFLPAVPLWLNLLAGLSTLPFACALLLLARLAKAHKTTIRDFLKARQQLRYP